MTGVYATAREFLERALSRAEARGDRGAARLIAKRICEVIEQEDFDEQRRKEDGSWVCSAENTLESTTTS